MQNQPIATQNVYCVAVFAMQKKQLKSNAADDKCESEYYH